MSVTAPQRRSIALRVPVTALRTIDQEARRRNLSRTEFIVQASTGTLDETVSEAFRRIQALEQAVERLQAVAY